MTTMASDSAARGENGKFSRYHWAFAFPALEDLYDLPSVKPFIEADETSVTIDAWTEKEQEIKHDVKIHQMKVRRLLVRKLLNTNSPTQAAQGSQHGEAYNLGTLANFDLQRLEAEDEANKEELAHPAALFLIPSFRNVGYGQVERQAPVLRTYPAILTNVLGQAASTSECLVGITVSPTLRDTSKALVSLLGEEEISEIIRKAPLNQDLFRCDACLAGMSSPMSWSQLVELSTLGFRCPVNKLTCACTIGGSLSRRKGMVRNCTCQTNRTAIPGCCRIYTPFIAFGTRWSRR
jgi:hypothetical protein